MAVFYVYDGIRVLDQKSEVSYPGHSDLVILFRKACEGGCTRDQDSIYSPNFHRLVSPVKGSS